MGYQALLFDLDGTLLQSDCSVSKRTLEVLETLHKRGLLLGIATARSGNSAASLLPELHPDITISSGGALVECGGARVLRRSFTLEETRVILRGAKALCGPDCEILADTVEGDFRNYRECGAGWSGSILTDFQMVSKPALRICVRMGDPAQASELARRLNDCSWIRFSRTDWYQFTKAGVSKEQALMDLCRKIGLSAGDVIAFGDDVTDIGMLSHCGKGVAMGNAVEEVKRAADVVIGDHDRDGIADYLTETLL